MTQNNTQPTAVLDKKVVARGFSLFFATVFICLLAYYWPMLKLLLVDKMHYHVPFLCR
ncbi:MAG: hypothetical protein WCG19_03210 [Chlorobiaceae bacterium]